MSRKNRDAVDKIKGQFVPMFYETAQSRAWKQLSFGARALFIALRLRCFKNNGHVYLSLRDAGEELGHKDRNDISNWYRELEHYGFLVKTEAGSLGVDGKGKAPHWRITDMPTRAKDGLRVDATQDFLCWDGVVFEPHVRPSRRWNPGKRGTIKNKRGTIKKQNPGRHVPTTVDGTSLPVVDGTFLPPQRKSGSDVTPISGQRSGSDVTPISKLATGVAGGSGSSGEAGRQPISTLATWAAGSDEDAA
jgi:hypothetical protein